MGSTTPTIKRPIAKIGSAGSDDVLERIDLIVPRVIIMKGRARLSSRGCVTNLALRRCLAARCMDR